MPAVMFTVIIFSFNKDCALTIAIIFHVVLLSFSLLTLQINCTPFGSTRNNDELKAAALEGLAQFTPNWRNFLLIR